MKQKEHLQSLETFKLTKTGIFLVGKSKKLVIIYDIFDKVCL